MDNTDKDTLIEKLQAEIDTLRHIIDMMPGNIFWKDKSGKYLGANKNLFKNTLNMGSLDELVGKYDKDLMDEELARATTDIDNDVMQGGVEKSIEEEGLDAQGRYAYYLTRKSPLYDKKNNLIGLLGVSLDITARKEMEENLRIAKQKAEVSNRAKTQFLAMISHEFRTPLASILGFAKLLGKNDATEKTIYLQHIIQSSNYLLSLVNHLLDYSKIEKNKITLTTTPVNLAETVEDVIKMLAINAQEKNLSLILDFDPTVPLEILIDIGIIKKILVNLISNAIKFTKQGHVIVRIKALSQTESTVKIYFAVEDTGIGIPQHEQKEIFKRFHQLGDIYTRDSSLQGTGLGLTIIKKLVKLLDSKIQLKSTLGQGSIFYFVADFKINSNHEKQFCKNLPVASQTIHEKSSLQQLNILLVEDDQMIQIIHRKMLQEFSSHIDIAKNAEEALAKLDNAYDILFIDIGLPDIDGFQLIKQIRAHKDYQHTPIIALTGYSADEERNACFAAGANEVAIKPVNSELLGMLLENHCCKIQTKK